MLVLSRKPRERIVIGNEIEVVVLEVQGNRVKLGINGPSEIPIHRGEVYARIERWQPASCNAECV